MAFGNRQLCDHPNLDRGDAYVFIVFSSCLSLHCIVAIIVVDAATAASVPAVVCFVFARGGGFATVATAVVTVVVVAFVGERKLA